MTDYNELSDFEINKRVANYRGGYLGAAGEHMPNGVAQRELMHGLNTYTERDYCNKWKDAGEVISEEGICLEKASINGAWYSGIYSKGNWRASHENPLRAAMIVFLMMKEERDFV